MGAHSKEPPYKVPDYRIYKVEDVPKLLTVQKVLGAQGLKDPWLRNEVWRYDPKVFLTQGQRVRLIFFRGFRYGFAAFLLTIGGTAIYDKFYPSEHEHDHH